MTRAPAALPSVRLTVALLVLLSATLALSPVPPDARAASGSTWPASGSTWPASGSPWSASGSPWSASGSPWSASGSTSIASGDVPPAPEADRVDSTFAFRDTFLPPGVPSVALRDDETAMLWNPAGLAMSPTYYLGYAWKGIYLGDDRKAATYFILTKARGFGLGYMHDDHSQGTASTWIFSIAPHVTRTLAVGVTTKWRRKDNFNFDCGMVYRRPNQVSIGVVGRNLADIEAVRRYVEGGIALTAVPRRLTFFFDVIDEDSPWRDALAYGGGFTARLEYGVNTTLSCFDDGQGHQVYRASLNFIGGVNIVEGEYSTSSDDHHTLSGRIANFNQ